MAQTPEFYNIIGLEIVLATVQSVFTYHRVINGSPWRAATMWFAMAWASR
jgi:hypothetical protein